MRKKLPFLRKFFFGSSTDVFVHDTSIIGPDVKLGPGVKIGPFCIVVGNVTIGAGTRLHANVIVGFPAQNIGTKKFLGSIKIGENCELREFVTVHASKYPDGLTSIGNNCYVMNYSHVSHDVILEDNVTLINNVNLGGHTHVERNAIMMANAATHQFCKIGKFSAVAPYTATRQDLPPFSLFSGLPAAFSGLNVIGLKRSGLSKENINSLKHVTHLFYAEKLALDEIKKLSQDDKSWGDDLYVKDFITFVENSGRGVSRRSINNSKENSEVEIF